MTPPGETSRTPPRRPLIREPGLIMTGIMLAYAALVFAWWPADIMVNGLSLVAWLMIVGMVLWVVLGFVYSFWMERLERQETARR